MQGSIRQEAQRIVLDVMKSHSLIGGVCAPQFCGWSGANHQLHVAEMIRDRLASARLLLP